MAHYSRTTRTSEAGFTLIEVLVVSVIIAILAALTFVNFGRPQNDTAVDSTVDTLVSDIRAQQILSMSGDTGSKTTPQTHGIYIEAGQYTLYTGNTFTAGASNNFVVSMPDGTSLTTKLTGGKLLFKLGTGEVSGYSGSKNTITVASGSATSTITLNRFGATTVN